MHKDPGIGSSLVLSLKSTPWELEHTGVEPEANQLTLRVGADLGSGSLRTQLWPGLAVVARKGSLRASGQGTA